MNNYDLIVIGAGPAGLMSALTAAARGAVVCLIEKNKFAGRKLLLTGQGKCNLTNAGELQEFLNHFGEKANFVRHALNNFNNLDLMSFFEERGLKSLINDDGRVFPATQRSQDILDTLLQECQRTQVIIRLDEAVMALEKQPTGFGVKTTKGEYFAKALIVATGGKSYPTTGSRGDGYFFAEKFGHQVTELSPALTMLKIEDYQFRDCAGVAIKKAELVFLRGNKKIHRATGDILFTHEGLSGPVILNSSRYVKAGDKIKMNLLPGQSRDKFENKLIKEKEVSGKKSLKSVLAEFDLPARLVLKIFDTNKIIHSLKMAQLDRKTRHAVVENVCALTVVVDEVGSFNEAMVTRGGVETMEINPRTMESKLVEGLFFVGEVVDIDADTGGYNLQWAFSSGTLAGENAGKGGKV